jgi:hypothetical protein
MLYQETATEFVLWNRMPINGIVHHPSIEQEWSAEELAAIGLYIPVEPEIPEGYHSVSFEVQRIDGVVQFVHTLAADEPDDPQEGA